MNSFKIINTDKFPEKWKTNKNLQWFLHNYPEEELLIHPEDEFIHPFLAVEFAKQFHIEEIEELKSLIKEATPHVKKSLDSIFEIDLRFSHMVKNKEACETWLEKAEKIKA